MTVSVRGESSPRTYSDVISTIPLPGLQTIDLSGAGFDLMQRNALHKLQYGPSTKVGGQSFTELPIRIIVYPLTELILIYRPRCLSRATVGQMTQNAWDYSSTP
ncbi:uncharacterized protein EDB91DRAFT_1138144, partial [Suillus paluster]|uniref:uncharacterized protein n=1 Tax=Suillus paluster TaxID=48578 RepID=UPI001B85CEAC